MEALTNQIENSNDELLILVKHHVNNKIIEYKLSYSVDILYGLRDAVVVHTVKTIRKKYLNDTKFELKKENIIKLIVENYLSKKILEIQY